MKVYPCICQGEGFCFRHLAQKTARDYLNCKSGEGYRNTLDKISGFPLFTDEDCKRSQNIISFQKEKSSILNECRDYDFDISKLKINILTHLSELDPSIKKTQYMRFVNLNDLDLGKFNYMQTNHFAESRAFFCDEIFDSEYIGLITSSWNRKYSGKNKIDRLESWQTLPALLNRTDVVLCANYSFYHPMNLIPRVCGNYFKDLGLKYDNGIGVWANQIICHTSIMNDLRDFLKRHTPVLIEKCHNVGLNRLDSLLTDHFKRICKGREIGLILEELVSLWFMNRKNIHIFANETLNPSWYL